MALADTQFTHKIPYFLDLLSRYNTAIPIQSQWMLVVNAFPSAIIEQVKEYEAFAKSDKSDSWNISAHIDRLTEDAVQKTKGCIFAQDVKMPPDGIGVERVGDFNGAYVKGGITTTRTDFGTLDASFLETNLSFVDLVLRPWAIMSAHKSLIARSAGGNNLKTNIDVYHLGKNGAYTEMVVRKHYTFYNCVPVSIDSEVYSYTGEKVQQRQVSFAYSYYTISKDAKIGE